MSEYICKIATIDEVKKNWDYEIKNHPDDNRWTVWKEECLKWIDEGKIIVYAGVLDGKIISNATATISKEAVQNPGDEIYEDELVNENTAYLNSFRTIKKYQNKGYFSKLYKFMENDLKKRGYKRLTLGVEPREVKNMKVYFKWGFDSYLKTGYETYPPKNENEEPENIIVNYYYKDLESLENLPQNQYNNDKQENGGNNMKIVKFFRCNECGKIEYVVEGEEKELTCCGKQMEELKANTEDAALEKHVPVYSIEDEKINVKVGEVEHPMTEEHYIMWIAYFDNNKVEFKNLSPNEKPEASFSKSDKFEIFAYCNLHGLWKTALS